jgi:AraC-like DNA-binding protein
MKIFCNLVEFSLHKNSLFFIIPKLLYELKSISSDSILTGVAFNSSFMIQNGLYLTSVEILEIFSSQVPPHYLLNEEEVHTLRPLFELLKNKTAVDQEANSFNMEIIRHCLLALIFEAGLIYQRYRTVREVKLTRKEEITLGFLKLLFVHFKKERSVQFYADSLFITSRHLSQVIKETTGKTAGELIDEAVIMQARLLLGNPSVNIAQVAETLQFSDQSFFGKFFKKHVGISPSEYRINSRVLQNPPF